MNQETRKQLLDVLDRILEHDKDVRFGQLIANLAIYAKGPFKSAAYDVEDEELLAAATRHWNNIQERSAKREEVKHLMAQDREKVAA